MQVSVETTQGLERRLTITVPAATVDAAVRKELNGLAKTRRIDGFRPGKAPVAIIKKMFGAMAHARVADEMMQNNFIKAIGGRQAVKHSGQQSVVNLIVVAAE